MVAFMVADGKNPASTYRMAAKKAFTSTTAVSAGMEISRLMFRMVVV